MVTSPSPCAGIPANSATTTTSTSTHTMDTHPSAAAPSQPSLTNTTTHRHLDTTTTAMTMMTEDSHPSTSASDDDTAKDGASTRPGAGPGANNSARETSVGDASDDLCSVVTSSTYSTVQVIQPRCDCESNCNSFFNNPMYYKSHIIVPYRLSNLAATMTLIIVPYINP